MVISKRPLREQIRDEVLARLVRGEYAIGSRINEGKLADDLGVSRTPLLRPNRGYWLSPVTADEVRETYPILGSLEVLALRSSDPVQLFAHAPRLMEVADDMSGSDPGTAGAKDDEFHTELLRFCPNQRLLQLIRSQKTVVHRYELAYFYEPGRVEESIAQHRRIVAALLDKDISRAAAELRDNWEIGMRLLVDLIGNTA
jgi:DNA-binding GntR family transcriptional regulator